MDAFVERFIEQQLKIFEIKITPTKIESLNEFYIENAQNIELNLFEKVIANINNASLEIQNLIKLTGDFANKIKVEELKKNRVLLEDCKFILPTNSSSSDSIIIYNK